MSDLLTICVPTYNRPEYLEQCLYSILDQSFREFRLIILDNASEKDYSGVISKFNDPRINYIRNRTNLGHSGNWKKALQVSSESEYVIIFHDDDLMHPKLIEFELNLLHADPNCAYVASQSTHFYDEVPSHVEVSQPRILKFLTPVNLLKAFLADFTIQFGSVMYRRSALDKIDFDLIKNKVSKFGDWLTYLEAAKYGTVTILAEPLVLYRRHLETDSAIKRPQDEVFLLNLMKEFKVLLQPCWNVGTAFSYYKYTGFCCPNYARGYRPEDPMSYLMDCRDAGIFMYPWAVVYVLWLLELELAKGLRRLLPDRIFKNLRDWRVDGLKTKVTKYCQ